MVQDDPRNETVEQLARQLRGLEQGRKKGYRENGKRVVSTGIPLLDGWLPAGGFSRGSLVEWLGAAPSSGMGSLAFRLAARLSWPGSHLVVMDPRRHFYPPAAISLGISWEQLTVIRPGRTEDLLWAWEQSLRCCGVSVVLGSLGALHDRVYRRFQLAAEAGGSIGFLFRSASHLEQPSWADVRLKVTPLPAPCPTTAARRVRLERVRARGAGSSVVGSRLDSPSGAEPSLLELEIDDATGDLRLVPGVAAAATVERATGT